MFNYLVLKSKIFLGYLFFKMGLVFFGGGYVVIPLLHRELVSNLHLLTERQFIDGIAISQLTPGPVAIFATFAGYCVSSVSGAIISTVALFLPGSLLMLVLSKTYSKISNSNKVAQVLKVLTTTIIGLLIATSIQMWHSEQNNVPNILEFLVAMFLLVRFNFNPAVLVILSAGLGFLFKF